MLYLQVLVMIEARYLEPPFKKQTLTWKKKKKYINVETYNYLYIHEKYRPKITVHIETKILVLWNADIFSNDLKTFLTIQTTVVTIRTTCFDIKNSEF
jgi:hypothetical protein